MPARMLSGVIIVLLHCQQAKPTNCHVAKVVAPCDLHQRLALRDPPQGYSLLVLGEFRPTAKLHSPSLRRRVC
jgi:hypothetical protein